MIIVSNSGEETCQYHQTSVRNSFGFRECRLSRLEAAVPSIKARVGVARPSLRSHIAMLTTVRMPLTFLRLDSRRNIIPLILA